MKVNSDDKSYLSISGNDHATDNTENNLIKSETKDERPDFFIGSKLPFEDNINNF